MGSAKTRMACLFAVEAEIWQKDSSHSYDQRMAGIVLVLAKVVAIFVSHRGILAS